MSEYTKGLYMNNSASPVASTTSDAQNRNLQDTRSYLANNPQYFEPARSNSFKFVVNDLSDLDLASFGLTNVPFADVSQMLELAVKESSVPQITIDPIEISRGNNIMKFAGKPKFNDGKLVIHDYIGAYTKEILLAWQRKAYDVRTGKVGLAADYKRTAVLYELTPDYQIVRYWTLYGCWVSAIDDGDFNHDGAEARTLSATIIYDYAEPQVYSE